MITVRDTEAIITICSYEFMYLEKLFKLMYYLDLLTYKETGKRFFSFDYVAESNGPVPKQLMDRLIDGSYLKKNPECLFFLPESKIKRARGVKVRRFSKDFVPRRLGISDLTRINFLKDMYGTALPSVMNEKDFVGKNFFKKEIENGAENEILKIDHILKQIQVQVQPITKFEEKQEHVAVADETPKLQEQKIQDVKKVNKKKPLTPEHRNHLSEAMKKRYAKLKGILGNGE